MTCKQRDFSGNPSTVALSFANWLGLIALVAGLVVPGVIFTVRNSSGIETNRRDMHANTAAISELLKANRIDRDLLVEMRVTLDQMSEQIRKLQP